jgi:endonuclease YncB( thermonuclease family)
MNRSIFSILLSLGLFSIAAPARADFTGVVVSVGDGETLTVKGPNQQNVTVRLACIDAPERAQAPWGADSYKWCPFLCGISTHQK